MSAGFAGKVAVVIGAASGIGRGLIRTLDPLHLMQIQT